MTTQRQPDTRPFVPILPSERAASLRQHLMEQVPAYQAALQEQPVPKHGMFTLTFNNRKKQGRGYRSEECMGVLYPEGNVHINTNAFHVREFGSLSEMREALEEWGDCWIRWEVQG